MRDVQERPELKNIPLDQLEFWEEANVRKHDVQLNIDDLAKNIAAVGLQVPLLVKERPQQKYLVFSGQRRLIACQMISKKDALCLVYRNIDLTDAQVLSLSENLYRQDMNEDDIAQAANNLYRKLKSIRKVSERLGVSESKVKSYLPYDAVHDEIKQIVRKGKLTAFQAINIYSKFPDKERAIEVAREFDKITQRNTKTKFFQSVKLASPHDTVKTLHLRAKQIGEMKRYEIYLPPEDSIAIKKIAVRLGIDEKEVIVRILELWIAEFRHGRVKFDLVHANEEKPEIR